MQIEINKEVSDYKETVFFGLTLRQCVCSVLAIVIAVVLYFTLKPYLGSELLSWVCMLGAAPFAAMGFFHYHGMTAEQFAAKVIRRDGSLADITLEIKGLTEDEKEIILCGCLMNYYAAQNK